MMDSDRRDIQCPILTHANQRIWVAARYLSLSFRMICPNAISCNWKGRKLESNFKNRIKFPLVPLCAQIFLELTMTSDYGDLVQCSIWPNLHLNRSARVPWARALNIVNKLIVFIKELHIHQWPFELNQCSWTTPYKFSEVYHD
jgi:hypothetical protein